MKRVFCLLLCSFMILGLIGCSSKDSTDNNTNVNTNNNNFNFPLTVEDIELKELQFEDDNKTVTIRYTNNSKVAITRLIVYYELTDGESKSIACESTTLPGETSVKGEKFLDKNKYKVNDFKLAKITVTFDVDNEKEEYNCFEYDYKLKKYTPYHEF